MRSQISYYKRIKKQRPCMNLHHSPEHNYLPYTLGRLKFECWRRIWIGSVWRAGWNFGKWTKLLNTLSRSRGIHLGWTSKIWVQVLKIIVFNSFLGWRMVHQQDLSSRLSTYFQVFGHLQTIFKQCTISCGLFLWTDRVYATERKEDQRWRRIYTICQ